MPKSLKTFLALSWACCVVTGHDWLGHPVKKGKVLYIALEDYFGVLRRLEAWRLKHRYSKADLDNLVIITVPINFAKEGSINDALLKLVAEGFCPDFVVIDTWFRSIVGADASSQEKMSEALAQLDEFKETLEVADEFKERLLPRVSVLIVAHTDKRGLALFGSIAQFAACDTLFMLDRPDEHAPEAVLKCVGSRYSAEPADYSIALENQDIMTDKGFESIPVVMTGGLDATLNKKVEDAKKPKSEQDLEKMMVMLAEDFGGSALHDDWLAELKDKYGPRGWSDATFDRKLGILRQRGQVVGGGVKGEPITLAPGVVVNSQNAAIALSTHPVRGMSAMSAISSPQLPSNYPHEGNEGDSSKSGNNKNSVENNERGGGDLPEIIA
jgi:hypothetical protein